jgi:hypothetical protein
MVSQKPQSPLALGLVAAPVSFGQRPNWFWQQRERVGPKLGYLSLCPKHCKKMETLNRAEEFQHPSVNPYYYWRFSIARRDFDTPNPGILRIEP